MLRYLAAVLVAVVVTLAAFMLMHRLIDTDAVAPVTVEPVAAIRFENIEIRNELEPRVRPQKPERQPPPDQPPPPDLMVEAPPLPREIPPIDRRYLRGTSVPGIRIDNPRQPQSGDGDVVPISTVAAQYPRDALMKGIEGQVTVRFTITALGTVRDAQVIDARPPRVFDQAALRAIARWKFKPRMANGVAVERVAVQTFDFTLPD
jgi:protein TonB